ncbi:MAG: SDR family NAD(P)-dependent oxidoreductase [Pseudomonadota bacterium]
MNDKVCLISGVGPGTGTALAKRFAEGGYKIAMLARDASRLKQLESEIGGARGYVCDVADEQTVDTVVAQVREDMGAPSILIHNAVRGTFGNFLEADPQDLATNFQINTMGFLYLARAVAPAMVEAGEGVILASGNTSALRGKPNFASFAPTKAAQRILAESMARELGPQGVHVAYVVIDAVIDVPWTREAFSDKPDEYFIQPSAIAETTFHVAHQERSGWSFNVEVRPFGEVW